MDFNKISGSTIDTSTSILFREFEDEKFYLAFMRQQETWGNCILINILLNDTTITNVISSTSGDGKFVDLKTTNLVDNKIYLYRTELSVSDFSSTKEDYKLIDELQDYTLTLQYINSNWAMIKGLPIDYANYINKSTGKFYLIKNIQPAYLSNPDSLLAIAKINLKSEFDTSIHRESVVLKSIKDSVETLAIYDLDFITNSLGEVYIENLIDTTLLISETTLLNDYARLKTEVITNSTPYFIIRKTLNQSLTIFEKLYLMKNIDETTNTETIWYTNLDEQYLLFKVVSSVYSQNIYLKITKGKSSVDLAIYHESLPYIYNTIESGNVISDANPPGLDSTYLKNQEIHESLFDIVGYVKIKKNQLTDTYNTVYSKVSFARELPTSSEKLIYTNYGFTENLSDSKHIETINLTSTTKVRHFGNVNLYPKTSTGTYPAGISRLYLYTNNFVIGDIIVINYFNSSGAKVYDQTTNIDGDKLQVTGVSYQEDNYYIEFNGVTSYPITYIPPDEADSYVFANIVSDETNVIASTEYAVCTSYLEATKYNMNKVMIEMKIPGAIIDTNLYSDIYRQLAIVHSPKFTNINTIETCTQDFHKDGLYDYTNHKYNAGTVVFLANKSPIYRQYLNGKELFKLII